MQENIVDPEQQIMSVSQALKKLQTSRRFRGHADLVADTKDQLAKLLDLHSRGQLEPLPLTTVPSWPWVAISLAILAGILRLLMQS